MGQGEVHVTGCGHSAIYQCQRTFAFDSQQIVPTAANTLCDERIDSPRYVVVSSGDLAAKRSRRNAAAIKETERDGRTIISAEIRPFVSGFRVVAIGKPDEDRQRVALRFHIAKSKFKTPPKTCDIRLLVNLKRVALDAAAPKASEDTYTWELMLPVETAAAIGTAHQAAWRVCGGDWDMNEDEQERLTRLAVQFRKATAWEEDPEGLGAQLVPPATGWPEWSPAVETPPASSQSNALSPAALYERIQGSVYPVHVAAGEKRLLGSAVAITKDRLLTNCHVLEGATEILVGSNNRMPAKIVKASPKSDRCVLGVLTGELQPLLGLRPHTDLKVGERVFTLGSPEGFENTLGEGLISGLREYDGLHYVQTSAPISQGSSGGGLFDDRGNLIGITTMKVVGENHTAESLNFAIASDEFFAP